MSPSSRRSSSCTRPPRPLSRAVAARKATVSMPASLRLPLQHAGVLGPVAPAASGVGTLLRILPIRLRREKQFLTVPVAPFEKKTGAQQTPGKKCLKKQTITSPLFIGGFLS